MIYKNKYEGGVKVFLNTPPTRAHGPAGYGPHESAFGFRASISDGIVQNSKCD